MSRTIEVVKDPILEVLEDPKNAKLSPMKAVYAGVGQIVTKLSSFVIKKTEDYDAAMSALKEAKEVLGKVDEAAEEAYGAQEAHVKRGKDLYKMITGPIDLGIKDLKQRMGKYQADMQKKRDDEAAALKLKADQEQAKLVTADTAKEQVKIVEKVAKLDAKVVAISDYKPKTVDYVRKFEVINPELVERKYCSPEDKKIRPFIGEVRGVIPEIAGVRIWDEPKIVTR